jgi:hypothetical protein
MYLDQRKPLIFTEEEMLAEELARPVVSKPEEIPVANYYINPEYLRAMRMGTRQPMKHLN